MKHPTTTPTAPLAARLLCWLLVVVGAAALGDARQWLGTTFPGFFLMPNRVVPSAGLPGWAGGRDGRPVYHHVLLAIDDAPVASTADAYRRVAARTPGDLVTYTFVRDGVVDTRRLPAARCDWPAFLGVFGAYGLTGLAYLLLAFVAVARWSRDERYPALAIFAWAGAAYSFTGMDLYGTGSAFRFHVAAEVFLAAGAAHVALVAPTAAFPRTRGLPTIVYGTAAMLTLVYQLFLFEPRAYSVIHNVAQGLIGLPIFALAFRYALALGDAVSARLRLALQLQLAAVLVGLVAPAVVFAVSALAGGDIPVSTAAWLNFLFPLVFSAGLLTVARAATPAPAPALA